MGSFSDKLAAALGVQKPCEIQEFFNRFKKHLDNKVVPTPLPEDVTLLAENFPYLIQLENPDPSNLAEWVSAKASVVVPLLEKRTFDDTGFRFDKSRARELLNLPALLSRPNCIHANLRHGHATKNISGEIMYVGYYGAKTRKVAFTIRHTKLNIPVVVSSFWTSKKWIRECAGAPALHVRSQCMCVCTQK